MQAHSLWEIGRMKPNRETILDDYKKFCAAHSCEEDCPYYTEEMLRDINCSALFVLDRVSKFLEGAPEKKVRNKNEVAACDLLNMLRRVMDINYGRKRGESEAQFQERKFRVFNEADEMIGNTEPQCED